MPKGKEKLTKEPNYQKSTKEGDSSNVYWVNYVNPESKKVKHFDTQKMILLESNHTEFACSSSNIDKVEDQEPNDADYSTYIPSLNYELEGLILARFPRSEYWKLSLVNKRYDALVKSDDLFKIRRHIGFNEPSVSMLASGLNCWWAFDRGFSSRRKLPVLPSDICFTSGDKESLCAGTHLLVSGREIESLMIWRYESATNKWFKGPSMINPRCLFASATCGNSAMVAGGVVEVASGTHLVCDTAEKYDPETRLWGALPSMNRRRKLCSGCYMDNRFYVIGGRNDEAELTCGEFFDEDKKQWTLIPGMLKDNPVLNCHSPPLIAVVDNELYSIEACSNQLKVYLKKSNSWKKLGWVPVRADCNRGWGVAFKSLGDELLVIGASAVSPVRNAMAVYTCRPNPKLDGSQEWTLVDSGKIQLSHFILNCSVMIA